MANIPNARRYTAAMQRPPVAAPDRTRPQTQPALARQPEAGDRGWIVGLALFLGLVVVMAVALGHPWLAAIGAAASGAGITHLLQR